MPSLQHFQTFRMISKTNLGNFLALALGSKVGGLVDGWAARWLGEVCVRGFGLGAVVGSRLGHESDWAA